MTTHVGTLESRLKNLENRLQISEETYEKLLEEILTTLKNNEQDLAQIKKMITMIRGGIKALVITSSIIMFVLGFYEKIISIVA